MFLSVFMHYTTFLLTQHLCLVYTQTVPADDIFRIAAASTNEEGIDALFSSAHNNKRRRELLDPSVDIAAEEDIETIEPAAAVLIRATADGAGSLAHRMNRHGAAVVASAMGVAGHTDRFPGNRFGGFGAAGRGGHNARC